MVSRKRLIELWNETFGKRDGFAEDFARAVEREALALAADENTRDAARYRWLQTQNSSTWHEFAYIPAERAAQIIDSEIEKERL